MTNVEQAYNFLKAAGMYYLATAETNGQPHVRIFTSYDIIDGKLFIQTSNEKDCFKQMVENSKVELCAFSKGKWIRIQANAIYVDDKSLCKRMLDDVPELRTVYHYDENDGKCSILYLENATATIYSFTEAPVSFKF